MEKSLRESLKRFLTPSELKFTLDSGVIKYDLSSKVYYTENIKKKRYSGLW